MSDTDKMLTERGANYGDFKDLAKMSQNLKCVMRNGVKWQFLSHSQRECLEMIACKIGRILSGDPNYQDSWTDIAGYARLAERQLEPTVAVAEDLKYGVNI